MFEGKHQTLLVFFPPLFGVILGGAAVHIVRVYATAAQAPAFALGPLSAFRNAASLTANTTPCSA